MQSATDIFVGWGTLHGNDYYVRQFRDMKIIPSTELIAPRLAEFATACGGALARAHARTGDPMAIASYIGKGPRFTEALSEFARRYADQNDRDHAQLVNAIAAGKVESQPG
jgi:sulfite reductase beta subunit-like hemoprotein